MCAQLYNLYRQFHHPSADKLFNILLNARPEQVKTETLEILKDISRRCNPCQRMKLALVRFRVMHCWATIYTGLPNCILTNQGSLLGGSEILYL